jgi:hypothetical protein
MFVFLIYKFFSDLYNLVTANKTTYISINVN